MKIKFQKLLLPYITYSTGFVIIYSFLYWLLIVKYGLFESNEFFYRAFLPFIVSGIIVLFGVWRKIKILNFEDTNHSLGALLITWGLLSIPVVTLNLYLNTYNGKLTKVESIDEIEKTELTKYYSIKDAIALKKETGIYLIETASSGREIMVRYYFACPLANIDSILYKNIWIGLIIEKNFSDRVFDDKVKQKRLIKDFKESALARFKEHIYRTTYLKRLTNSIFKEPYLEAINNAGYDVDQAKIIILEEEKGIYEQGEEKYFTWTVVSLIASNIVWLVIVLFVDLRKE